MRIVEMAAICVSRVIKICSRNVGQYCTNRDICYLDYVFVCLWSRDVLSSLILGPLSRVMVVTTTCC